MTTAALAGPQPQPHRHRSRHAPSRTALATRSLRLALAVEDPEERAQALGLHFALFAPPLRRRSCPVPVPVGR